MPSLQRHPRLQLLLTITRHMRLPFMRDRPMLSPPLMHRQPIPVLRPKLLPSMRVLQSIRPKLRPSTLTILSVIKKPRKSTPVPPNMRQKLRPSTRSQPKHPLSTHLQSIRPMPRKSIPVLRWSSTKRQKHPSMKQPKLQ